MSISSFVSKVTRIALVFGFFSSLSFEAISSPIEEESPPPSPTTLISAFSQNLSLHPSSPSHESLQNKASTLQQTLGDDLTRVLMDLWKRYVQNIRIPGNVQEKDHPSFQILDALADLEKPHENPNVSVSSFCYNALEDYVVEASIDHQKYYLNLFADLLKANKYEEEITHSVIQWGLAFMYDDHTKEQCTQIANIINDFLNSTDPAPDAMILQKALDDEITAPWPPEFIIENLQYWLFEEGNPNADTAVRRTSSCP